MYSGCSPCCPSGLVCNAGVGFGMTFSKTLAVNLYGTRRCCEVPCWFRIARRYSYLSRTTPWGSCSDAVPPALPSALMADASGCVATEMAMEATLHARQAPPYVAPRIAPPPFIRRSMHPRPTASPPPMHRRPSCRCCRPTAAASSRSLPHRRQTSWPGLRPRSSGPAVEYIPRACCCCCCAFPCGCSLHYAELQSIRLRPPWGTAATRSACCYRPDHKQTAAGLHLAADELGTARRRAAAVRGIRQERRRRLRPLQGGPRPVH